MRNQYINPLAKPFPLAATRSRTIAPSSLATTKLNHVRPIRNAKCAMSNATSLQFIRGTSLSAKPGNETYNYCPKRTKLSEKASIETDLPFNRSGCLTSFVKEQPLMGIKYDWTNGIYDYPCFDILVGDENLV